MALIFDLKVSPSAHKQAWKISSSGILKCWLTSQPENNKANNELIKLLSKTLSVSQNSVQIIAGATSRTKKIKIDIDITYEKLLHLLHIETQLPLFK